MLSRMLDLKCLTLERVWTKFDRQLLTQAWNSIHLWNEKGHIFFLVPLLSPLLQPRFSTWSNDQSSRRQMVHWECAQHELTQKKSPSPWWWWGGGAGAGFHSISSWTWNQYVIIHIWYRERQEVDTHPG